MEHWEALIEWESSGLNDVPTENIVKFIAQLSQELLKRQQAEGQNDKNSNTSLSG